MREHFTSHSDALGKGILSVFNQKPTDLFNNMTNDQLKIYINFIFSKFTDSIN